MTSGKWTTPPSCAKESTGSSGEREAEGAERIWIRSLDSNLRYVHFISDSDCSTFLEVTRLNIGRLKEECVSHVQKRLVTALRNLGAKQRIKSGYGGSGKLT